MKVGGGGALFFSTDPKCLCGSSVVRHLPLVLEVPGSIPARGEKNFGCPNTLSLVSFAGMTLDKCMSFGSGRMSPVQGKSPPVQVKEPYGNLDKVTCRLSSCNSECTKFTCR